ncbi:hypothetical protein [Vibrio sp. 10N.261.46.A3]|uniref:hypothetical protein n=1 Tax=Vibrio sp. 10N.261.46.A3 TaxID=3229658 RepID=UPI0035526DDB
MEVFGSLATIIGLIYNFKSGRDAKSDREYHDFLNWLEENRYKNIIKQIEDNDELVNGVESLLRESHDTVIDKLNFIEDSVSGLVSGISGLNTIAHAVRPNAELSEQAQHMLKNFVESQGSFILELKTKDGDSYMIADGDGRQLGINEPRFVEDDFNSLCSLGLLTPDVNSKGSQMYRITRRAVRYVSQLDLPSAK